MRVAIKESRLIKILNDRFPGIKAAPAADFYGASRETHTVGIWFRGTEDAEIDGLPVYDHWGECGEAFTDTLGVNPALDAILAENGWFAEPYDAGTLMASPM